MMPPKDAPDEPTDWETVWKQNRQGKCVNTAPTRSSDDVDETALVAQLESLQVAERENQDASTAERKAQTSKQDAHEGPAGLMEVPLPKGWAGGLSFEAPAEGLATSSLPSFLVVTEVSKTCFSSDRYRQQMEVRHYCMVYAS